jgi:hypothetical protein
MEWLLRLAIGIARPRRAEGGARAIAAARKGRMANTEECDKCMSD